MRGLKRRDFLLLSGAAAGAAAMNPFGDGGSRAPIPADVDPPLLPGLESFVSTTCLMCPGACGMRVRLVDGVPVGIRGNPDHPVNAGGVCAEGLASLQLLYHPDRLLQPLKRVNGREEPPRFESLSWDEAMEMVLAAMKDLSEKRVPEKLAFAMGRTGGTMSDLVELFMSAWGSESLYLDRPHDGMETVFEMMHGIRARPAFDFDNTGLVLSFGADLLNAWESPIQFQRSCASFRDVTRVTPGSLILADVRFSETAARASEWVAINPGSYGALALGIAYVMLRERLYDETFAEQRLYGFDDFGRNSEPVRQGFQSMVLRDYSPETVSQLTGVPVEQILALGKRFGESASALAVFGESVFAQPGGLYAAMAVHSLNLLKGNINREGGIYLQPEVPLAPISSSAGIRSSGNAAPKVMEDLAGLSSEEDLPEILFLYHSNPLFSSPFKDAVEQVLAKIPLVVSFSPLRDETSRHADLILPDALFLERWEDRLFPSCSPIPGWGLVQPCMPAQGECRHSGDVLLQLAKLFGAPLDGAMPWESFEELLRHRAKGLFETQAGTLSVDAFDQGLVAEMERRGWWMPGSESFEEFWEELRVAGAWTDPHFRVRTLLDYSGNRDGRIDLYSRELERRLALAGSRISDKDCLPHYEVTQAQGEDDEYTFVLHPFRPGRLGSGTSGILPWTLQKAGALQGEAWNSWAEIHPEDAAELELQDGSWIWIESRKARIRVRAAVYPGAVRGVAAVPYGFGHEAMGKWAEGRGVNPIDLIESGRDELTGMSHRYATRVKIYRA